MSVERDRGTCIYEYERMLFKQAEKTLPRLIGTVQSKKEYEEKAREIVKHVWHYAITEILEWTPQQAVLYLDDALVEMLCLDRTLKMIDCPSRKDANMPDYSFVLSIAFPDEIHWGNNEWELDIFKKCAHLDEYSASDKVYEYPKGFFLGAEGEKRGLRLLDHILKTYFDNMSIYELYELFSKRRRANMLLKKYALSSPAKLFDSPLHFLHETLETAGLESEEFFNEFLQDKKE